MGARAEQHDLAAVILAGGQSRRMGRDKATLKWRGDSLVSHTVTTTGARCAPVVVVKSAGQDLGALTALIVDDDVAGQGPLVALGHGLRVAAGSGAGRAFVCAVDMPLMTPRLIDELAIGMADVTIAVAGGRDHYLAAIYRTELCADVDELTGKGERRLGALIESVRVQRVSISDPVWVTNVNTEEELAALSQLP